MTVLYDLNLRNLSETQLLKIQEIFIKGKLYQSSRPIIIELTQIPQGQAPSLWNMKIFHLPPKQEAHAHVLLCNAEVYPVIKESRF